MGQTLKTFLEAVGAELFAGFLLIVLGGVLSKKARWVLTATLGRLLDVDIEYVFRNKREADDDIRKEIERSSFVSLLTGRGNELQRDTFAGSLSAKAGRAKRTFRLLLPVSESKPGERDWTAQREAEMSAVDSAFGSGILKDQIQTTVKFLQPFVDSGTVELKRFNYPHIGRILITDRVAYFSPYLADAHGRDSRVIKYRRGGDMYDSLLRLFDQLWSAE